MSKKPPKYCFKFPCRNLAEPGSSYCKDHKPKPMPKVADAFYLSPQWRRFRDWHINKHPLCESCLADGYTEQATVVDHIVELKDGGKPFDEDNAQSLCAACHNRKSAQARKERGLTVYAY